MPEKPALIPIQNLEAITAPGFFCTHAQEASAAADSYLYQYSRPHGYAEYGYSPQAAFHRSHAAPTANRERSATFSPEAELYTTRRRFCPEKRAVLRIARLSCAVCPENPALSRRKCCRTATSPETGSVPRTKFPKRRTIPSATGGHSTARQKKTPSPET